MRKLLEAIGLVGLAALVWLTYSALYGLNRLPDRVPTHFDAAGNPTGWGSPHGMIFMPVTAGALYLLMSVAARFPLAFHYPVRVTDRILPRLQAVTLNMLAWVKAELVWLFVVLQWVFIRTARAGEGHLFRVILPGVLVVILSTVGWYIVALLRTASADAGSD